MVPKLILFSAGLSLAFGLPSQSVGQPANNIIRSEHERRPENVVRIFEGRCDGTPYTIAIRPEASSLSERLQSLRAGRREITDAVRALVLSRLPATAFIIDAVIHECGPAGSSRARIRLNTVDRPWHGNPNRSLYFWLSRTGDISDVVMN